MSNDLNIRFRVVPAQGDPILTTSVVDANYQASQLKVETFFEEYYRERTPETVEKSIPHATVPTDDPSPEELQRRKDAESKKDEEVPVEEEAADDEDEKPTFGLRVPGGTSRLPSGFDPQRRDPEAEEAETLPPPEQFGRHLPPTATSEGHVVSPVSANKK